eukprot:9529981-Alexandrium_andersonii.AAC.1
MVLDVVPMRRPFSVRDLLRHWACGPVRFGSCPQHHALLGGVLSVPMGRGGADHLSGPSISKVEHQRRKSAS